MNILNIVNTFLNWSMHLKKLGSRASSPTKQLTRRLNMNLDDKQEVRELNIKVENYFSIEFVAIPPDFNLESYLSMREQVGITEFKDVDIGSVKKIAMAVTHSPVFAVMNNALLSVSSCMYFLHIINELGLVLKTIPNPMRMSGSDYKYFIKNHEQRGKHDIYIRGQEVNHLNFIIVNLFPMMEGDVITEAMTIAQNLQKYQAEVDEKLKSIS